MEGNEYDEELKDDASKQDTLSLLVTIIIYLSALLVGFTDQSI